jgi:hypothetical protein
MVHTIKQQKGLAGGEPRTVQAVSVPCPQPEDSSIRAASHDVYSHKVCVMHVFNHAQMKLALCRWQSHQN